MTDTPEPAEPTSRPAQPRDGAATPFRAIGLGIVGFAATLVLLFGLASLVGGGDRRAGVVGGAGASASSGTAANPSPAPSASASSPADPAGASPPAGPDPVLIGAGDIADCDLADDGATAELVTGIAGTVFTAGDNVYDNGTLDEFHDCYDPTWGRFRSRTRPAPGNHDHNTKDLAGYRTYFGAAAAPTGTTWYSYELGTWHIVVLDSSCDAVGGCGPDSEQGRWLAADLAASRARCTLAIWHHPRFSSGEHGSDASVAPFWRALYDAGAEVVVNGHDHDYERFAPQDPNGRRDGDRGLREFVVGTGGAALRDFGTTAANSVVRASLAHGIIRFDLHPSGYEWRFISTTGEFGDSGAGTCH